MISFRNRLLLANFFLLLLFNYGYMQLRVPQAQIGIPISEWLLLFTLVTVLPLRVLGRMRNLSILLPYFAWLIYGLAMIMLSYFDHGVRAIRDGLPVIESLFLYVGFVFAEDEASLQKLKKWFPRVFVIGVFYCALVPFTETLRTISPIVSGIQGQPIPILFNIYTTAMLMVLAAAYALERYREVAAWRYLILASAAISMAVFFLSSRTLLLMIFVLFAYFLFSGTRRLSLALAGMIAVSLAFLLVLLSLGIENTRLGITNLTGYKTLFLEIFPETERALTSGTSARLLWWVEIYDQLTSSWKNLFFGLGYGIPLTDLRDGDVIVYSPHNLIVGVIGRGGLIAGFTFIWLQSVIIFRGWGVVRELRNEKKESAHFVALLFVIITVHIIGIGESPFAWPCYTVPYYFSAGILLRMHRNIAVEQSLQRPARNKVDLCADS